MEVGKEKGKMYWMFIRSGELAHLRQMPGQPISDNTQQRTPLQCYAGQKRRKTKALEIFWDPTSKVFKGLPASFLQHSSIATPLVSLFTFNNIAVADFLGALLWPPLT